MRGTALTAIGTLFVAVSGCTPSSSSKIVSSAISPDGKIEALVVESNGGATTSFGYQVELRKVGDRTGTEVAALYGSQRNESAYGVNVKWAQPNSLHIEYLRAKSVTQRFSSVAIDGRTIAVSLDTGILDPSAKSGGMTSASH